MSAAEKIAAVPPPPRPTCKVPDRGDVVIGTLTLDNSKPSTVPGMMSSTLRTGGKGSSGIRYQSILFVPRLRAFQIECVRPDGKVETVFVPEHLVIQWVAEETQP